MSVSGALKVKKWKQLKRRATAISRNGSYKDAIPLLLDYCQKNVDNADSFCLLGSYQAKVREYAAAVVSFERAFALNPLSTEAALGRAQSLRALGKFESACQSLRTIVERIPDCLDAYILLADLYISVGNISGAGVALDAAQKLRPGSPKILSIRARFYSLKGQFHLAEDDLRRLLDLQPGDAKTRFELGRTLLQLGDAQGALEQFQLVRERDRDNTDVIAAMALAYEWCGDRQAASELLQPAIERRVCHSGVALVVARLTPGVIAPDTSIRYVTSVLDTGSLSPNDQRLLRYALARIFDGMGEYELAFEHASAANALQQAQYNVSEYSRFADRLIAALGAQRKDGVDEVGNRPIPVFVVGMPRSGTSVVEQILAAHSGIEGMGECQKIIEFAGEIIRAYGDQYGERVAAMGRAEADELANRYMDGVSVQSESVRYVVDKMPHNFAHLGLVAKVFPNARVIHCRRDMRDTCLSVFFQDFNDSHPYATRLDWVAEHYKDYVRIMEQWHSTDLLPTLTLDYENLAENTESVVRSMLQFLGLPWESDCLRFYESRRFVRTASYQQVREAMHTRSVGRWRHYEKYLPLSLREGVPGR